MKKLIIATALLFASSSALAITTEGHEFCSAFADVTREAGGARDLGIPELVSLKVANNSPDAEVMQLSRMAIKYAYQFSQATPQELHDMSYSLCINSMKED